MNRHHCDVSVLFLNGAANLALNGGAVFLVLNGGAVFLVLNGGAVAWDSQGCKPLDSMLRA